MNAKDNDLNPLDALRSEHEEIRAVLNKLEGFLKKQSPAGKGGTNGAAENENDLAAGLNEITAYFDKDLEAHFKREEEALFPVLGNYIGIETGPINVMIIEHNNCRELFNDFKKKIAGKDYKPVVSAGNSLRQLLSEHEDKEDSILFHIAEMQLTKDEKRSIMEKMLTIN